MRLQLQIVEYEDNCHQSEILGKGHNCTGCPNASVMYILFGTPCIAKYC